MNRRHLLVLTLASSLVGGCATATGPQFQSLDAVSPEMANVYVYRQSAVYAIGQAFTVELDGKRVGSIANASYLKLQVQPGKSTVTIKPGGMAKSSEYPLNAEAGKNYFLEFDFGMGVLANPFFIGSDIKAREQDMGVKALTTLKSVN